MKRIMTISAALTALFIISACTVAGPPSIPTELTASTDLHEKIELTWNADPNAGVFHIYRGLASAIEKTDDAYLGSAALNAFIDTGVDIGVTYYYALCAADPFGTNETSLSTPVSGIAPDYIWSAPATVAPGLSGALFAAGGTAPRVVTVSSADGSILHYEYNAETGWTAAGATPGSTANPASINAAIIGGGLYTAFTDSAGSDAITVRLYDGETGWETVGEAGAADVAGPVSLAGSGFINPDIYMGYLNTGDAISTRYYPDPTDAWAALGTIDATSVTLVHLTVFGGNPYLFFEDTESILYGMVYEDTPGWTILPDIGAGDIESIASASGSEILYIASTDASGNLTVRSYSAGAWESLGTGFSGVSINPGAVSLAEWNETLYLVYISGTETVVTSYSDGTWTVSPGDPGENAAALDLDVFGSELRLLTLTASGTAEIRTFE